MSDTNYESPWLNDELCILDFPNTRFKPTECRMEELIGQTLG